MLFIVPALYRLSTFPSKPWSTLEIIIIFVQINLGSTNSAFHKGLENLEVMNVQGQRQERGSWGRTQSSFVNK